MADWNKASRRENGESASFSQQPWLLQLVDLGLAATLVVAPFCMGGRTPLGQLILCALSTFTALCWCLFQCRSSDARWKFTGAEPVMLLAIGLIILQCCELPPEWLASLSPKIPEILSLWNADHDSLIPGTWNRISLTPYDSLSSLVVIVACVQFFFVAAQRLRRLADLQRLLAVLAVGGGVMAVFGIVQLMFSNGKFFWIYQHPQSDTWHAAKGAFSNANHFAHYLALMLPAQLLLLLQCLESRSFKQARSRSAPPLHVQQPSRWVYWEAGFWAACFSVTALAVLLSMSRGGIVVCVAGMMVLLTVLWSKSLLGTQTVFLLLLLASGALGGTMMFGDLAAQMVEQNFLELSSSDVQQLDQNGSRRKIWDANLQGIAEFPIVGTGLGSHREVYWRWFHEPHRGKEYSHAESGFLQVPLETGIIGASLAGLLWLIALLWCAQGLWNAGTPQSSGIMAVTSAAMAISLVHSITDFVWYVPACMNVILVYAVCAWRISLMRFTEQAVREASPTPTRMAAARIAWGGAIPVVLLLGGAMIFQKLPEVAAAPAWDEFMRLTFSAREKPSANDEFNSTETLQLRRDQLVISAADADPHHHRAQLQAGLASLNMFARAQLESGNSMPLRQIREAAHASFQDLEEMQRWLNQPGVLGENRRFLDHAIHYFRASLAGCPLQPRPYLELADLVWLEGGEESSEVLLVQQAVRGRPQDARANFAQGTIRWLDGDHTAAIPHWRKAFQLDPSYRGHIITTLSSYMPPAFFLDNLDLDLEGLKQLSIAYQKTEDRRGYLRIVDALGRESVRAATQSRGLAAEQHWLLAHQCFHQKGDRNSAYRAALEALKSNPASYQAHQTLGMWLFENGAYEEALPYLTWCYRRKPDAVWLGEMTRQAAAKKSTSRVIAEEPKKSVIR